MKSLAAIRLFRFAAQPLGLVYPRMYKLSSDEDDVERDTETGSHDSDTDTVASCCSSEVETIRDTDTRADPTEALI